MTRITILGLLILTLSLDVKAVAATTNPPGTKKIRIQNSVCFVDKQPVSNIDWKEALCCLKACSEEKIGTPECNCTCLSNDRSSTPLDVDSMVWKRFYGDIAKTDVRYAPIIGVSNTQMQTYCRVRSRLVNYKSPKTVTYKLLSEQDYNNLTTKRWRHLDAKSEYGEMTADGTVYYRGSFVSAQEFHGPITFRCKAVL